MFYLCSHEIPLFVNSIDQLSPLTHRFDHARDLGEHLLDLAWPRGEVDAGSEPDAADVEHVGQALEAHRRLGPGRLELARALEQALVAVEIERREPGRAGERMRRVGVAVKQLDHVHGPAHERVVDPLAHDHSAHRHAPRGDALGKRDHVGDDAVALGGKGVAEPAEAGDDLVEDEQDAVLVTDRAQPRQVALGCGQHAGGARHRLDDHGGDGGGVVQRDDALELVGQMGAPLGLALAEGLVLAVVGRRQMVDAGEQRAEQFAIVDHAADRNAAEADAVVAALAPDQARARAFAAHVVIGERDLERGVHRLRARIAEEHVVEVAGRERGNPARKLERLGMGELKGRRVVERGRFRLDRRNDGVAIVPGVGAPHAGGAVEHGAPVGGVVMHVLGARDQPRRRLERAVGRERKPIGFEVVGDGDRPLCWCRWHGAVSFAAFPDAARDGAPCCVSGRVPCRCAERLLPPAGRQCRAIMADKPDKTNKLKARLPRGLADRGGAEIAATRRMLDKIRAVYERYGFEPLETPAIEYTDALGKFLPDQDRPNEGVFSFQDDDEQWLSLRYDLTAPLARYVAENFDALPKPYRSYREGVVFRNEKPGPGRFRQFMQFDADTVGSASMAADAEICMMAADTMEALGIKRGDYVVKVNNRKVLDGVLEAIGLGGEANQAKRLTVLRAIDKLDRLGAEGVRQLLGEGRKDESGDFTKGAGLSGGAIDRVLAFVQSKGADAGATLANLAKVVAGSARGEAGVDELRQMSSLTTSSNYADDRILIDPSVVRGLEYYTGPVY